jgi:hypothetical protein
MKRRVIAVLAALVVLLAARVAYVYADATYISTLGPECITVRDSMTFVTRDFLDKHPGCKIVAGGVFEGAAYAHIECGDAHIVTGSHVAFDGKTACERFASLGTDARMRAVGDHLGRK